jgi:hypothetical protein
LDDQALQKLIASLDESVPKEGARVLLTQYGGGPDESQIVANQRGYLRLGIELLKAAYSAAPETDSSRPHVVYPDFDYLLTKDSTINFDWCERREPGEERAKPASVSERLVPMFFFGIIIGFLVLALVGLVTVVKWIAG